MKPIIERTEPAERLVFQPNDGTRYTAFFVSAYADGREDNIYVALGSGDYVYGGYYMRPSSLRGLASHMLVDMGEGIFPTEFLFGSEKKARSPYHYMTYQFPKFYMGRNRTEMEWTLAVFVLLGLLVAIGDPFSPDDLALIGAVYRDDMKKVRFILERLLVNEEEE